MLGWRQVRLFAEEQRIQRKRATSAGTGRAGSGGLDGSQSLSPHALGSIPSQHSSGMGGGGAGGSIGGMSNAMAGGNGGASGLCSGGSGEPGVC